MTCTSPGKIPPLGVVTLPLQKGQKRSYWQHSPSIKHYETPAKGWVRQPTIKRKSNQLMKLTKFKTTDSYFKGFNGKSGQHQWIGNFKTNGNSKKKSNRNAKKEKHSNWVERIPLTGPLLDSTELRKFSENLKINQETSPKLQYKEKSGRWKKTTTYPRAVAQYQMT